MTKRQSEVLEMIEKRWSDKKRGTYIDRKISRTVYALYEMGFVKIFPYCIEFGNEAFPHYAE